MSVDAINATAATGIDPSRARIAGAIKEAGSQLGYGQYADAISKSSSGSYSVSDPAARTAILKLRDDPAASSSMAAVLTQSNSFKLTGQIGRRPTDSELYI